MFSWRLCRTLSYFPDRRVGLVVLTPLEVEGFVLFFFSPVFLLLHRRKDEVLNPPLVFICDTDGKQAVDKLNNEPCLNASETPAGLHIIK